LQSLAASEVIQEGTSIRPRTVGKAESGRLVVEGRSLEGKSVLSGRDVLGQIFGALVSSQKVSIDLLEVAASDEVVNVDIGLTNDVADGLNIGVVVVAEESETLSSLESQFAFDSSVEFVSEGLEENNELDIESSGSLGLLEEDNLNEGVNVGGIQMQIDSNQEFLEGEDGKSDSGNFSALGCRSSRQRAINHVVHEEWVVVQEVRLGSTVVGHLEVRLAAHDCEHHYQGCKELDTGAHSLFIKSYSIRNGGS